MIISQMDWPVGDAAGVVALVASAVSIFETYRQRAVTKVRNDVMFSAAADVGKANAEKCALLERELAEQRLSMAQHYASLDALAKVEQRLFTAIDGVTLAIRDLAARLDRAFDRKD